MPAHAVHPALVGSGRAPEEGCAAFVEAAIESCGRRGLNLTPIRRSVLEVVAESSVPVSAYAIIHRLSGTKLIAPPTVYRALEFLIDAGLVRHLALRKAYVRCELQPGTQVSAVLLCNACGAVSEAISPEMTETIGRLAAAAGFVPGEGVVEIEGHCAICSGTLTV